MKRCLMIVLFVLCLLTACDADTSVEPETRPDVLEGTLNLEGDPFDVTYALAEQTAPAEVPAAPSFSIYVDTHNYEMTEEDGVTYIRKIIILPTEESVREENSTLLEGLSEEEAEEEVKRIIADRLSFYNNLPPCEMEIRHLADILPKTAAENAWSGIDSASEVSECQQPDGWAFYWREGQEWNSPMESYYYVSDGGDGTFQITIRFYLEAEGVQVALRTMLQTFEVTGQ